MTTKALRVLLAGFRDETAASVVNALQSEAAPLDTEHVATLTELRRVLDGRGGDIVLVDENPDLNVSTALALIGELNQDVPVMVVTDRPDIQVTAMQNGARDAFGPNDLIRLRPAIEREY